MFSRNRTEPPTLCTATVTFTDGTTERLESVYPFRGPIGWACFSTPDGLRTFSYPPAALREVVCTPDKS